VRGSGLGLDLVFHAEAFAFDDDRLGVMEDTVEDGAGDAGVVTKDLGPVFVGFIGGENAVPFVTPLLPASLGFVFDLPVARAEADSSLP
jgi:hypothetical protein